jgi:wyosine [tRNA(Phe)-imidazoG37] synthetase (radical SAM superfamily)
MLIANVNDTDEALRDIASGLSRIRSDEIHLALPLRPPAEAWVAPSHPDRIARAQEILGSAARVLPPIPGGVLFTSEDDIVEAVVNVISRHPMEEGDLIRALQNWSPGRISGVLEELKVRGRAQVVSSYGKRFWHSSAARYGRDGKTPPLP